MAQIDVYADKKHSLGFEYVSIQNLSNHLRRLCAQEGLDIEFNFTTNGYVDVTIVNADDPSDFIGTMWPVVEGDKGWAYTVKYPLVRMFLIGDPAENDEAEMAERSGRAAAPPWSPPRADAEFKTYSDPANREPAGPPVRRRPPRGPFHEDDAA